MLVYVAGLLIWSDGLFIFWTYHTPHMIMISVFLCCWVLGTLVCIWNNGRRYSICCFTILHTAISLSWTVLLHIISSLSWTVLLHCCRVLGTLICIWNNGCRYSICCFTILHTTISLSWTVLLHIISSKQRFSSFKILIFFF